MSAAWCLGVRRDPHVADHAAERPDIAAHVVLCDHLLPRLATAQDYPMIARAADALVAILAAVARAIRGGRA